MIFRPELAAKIVLGKKTATRRAISDNPRSPWRFAAILTYQPGMIFAVQPGRGVTRVAEARVTGRRIEPLSAVLPADARREGFSTRDGFVAAWRAINGSWDPDQRVHVIEFKLEGPTCMGCDGCGWCEGAPAFSCQDCRGTGRELSPGARRLLAELNL